MLVAVLVQDRLESVKRVLTYPVIGAEITQTMVKFSRDYVRVHSSIQWTMSIISGLLSYDFPSNFRRNVYVYCARIAGAGKLQASGETKALR